jgi:hypothetical protein
VTDVASIESVFERTPDSKAAIQNSKSIRKNSPPTKRKLQQRTADKVLRLLSVHISFAVDVR